MLAFLCKNRLLGKLSVGRCICATSQAAIVTKVDFMLAFALSGCILD